MDELTHARIALEQVCARGDLARARELYADDFVDHVKDPEFRGQEGIARSVAMYRVRFPDRVVSRWVLNGTHRGHPVTLPGITISRFEDGMIAEDWTVAGNLGLLGQIGLRRGLALAVATSAARDPDDDEPRA
jgi:hypothetical protein